MRKHLQSASLALLAFACVASPEDDGKRDSNDGIHAGIARPLGLEIAANDWGEQRSIMTPNISGGIGIYGNHSSSGREHGIKIQKLQNGELNVECGDNPSAGVTWFCSRLADPSDALRSALQLMTSSASYLVSGVESDLDQDELPLARNVFQDAFNSTHGVFNQLETDTERQVGKARAQSVFALFAARAAYQKTGQEVSHDAIAEAFVSLHDDPLHYCGNELDSALVSKWYCSADAFCDLSLKTAMHRNGCRAEQFVAPPIVAKEPYNANKTSVVIVDSNPLTLAQLKSYILTQACSNLEVHMAFDGTDAQRAISRYRPWLLITSSSLDHQLGEDHIRDLNATYEDRPRILLHTSAHEDQFSDLTAGPDGDYDQYVPKNIAAKEFQSLIRDLARANDVECTPAE